MEIEYKDEFDALQDEGSFRGQQWFGKRQELVEEYSWAVPNERVILYLSEFGHLYEPGAGSGYWANLIERAGGDVTAFDIDPPDETWTDVEEGTPAPSEYDLTDEPVLMVWPPYDESMAADVVAQRPSHVLYVGEQRGGCTADDEFFDLLDERYGLVAHIELPSYAGVRDDFYHYIRKV